MTTYDNYQNLRLAFPYAVADLPGEVVEGMYDEDSKTLGVIYWDDNDMDNNPRGWDNNLCCIFVPRTGPFAGDTSDIRDLYDLLGRKGCDVDFDEWTGDGVALQALCAEYNIELRPLYAYVHSGITISLAPFSCPWDSGQCGWVWADGDDPEVQSVAANLKDGVDSIMQSEIEVFDQFLRGDVYGIGAYTVLEDGHIAFIDYDEVWGFYGLDCAREELRNLMGVDNAS